MTAIVNGGIFTHTHLPTHFHCAHSDELDLDGQGGKMFLRVLVNMVMHNYPSLVSGALQLLFRHFSQRQEVLNAFTQVIVEDNR